MTAEDEWRVYTAMCAAQLEPSGPDLARRATIAALAAADAHDAAHDVYRVDGETLRAMWVAVRAAPVNGLTCDAIRRVPADAPWRQR